MATTDNLGVTLIESSQVQMDVTANAAFSALDAALTELVTVASSDTPVLVAAATIQPALCLLLSAGATGAHSVVLPGVKHTLMIANDSGYTATVTCLMDAPPTMAVVIPNGERRLVYCDGETLYVGTQPCDIQAFYVGVPTNSALMWRVPVARAITFPIDMAGSYGRASAASTGTVAFDIQKDGVTIATATFTSSAVASFTTAGGTAQALVAGDVLSIVCPAAADATLADIGFALAGIG